MKKGLVISHERSGTSFLINTIALNFPHYLPEFVPGKTEGSNAQGVQRVDLDGQHWNFADPQQMCDFLFNSQFDGLPVRNIFKSHHPYEYFEPLLNDILRQYRIFYICRDGRDVMKSFWRHIRKQGYMTGPTTFTLYQFITSAPSGANHRYHGRITPINMVDRWDYHVVSWMDEKKDGIFYVSYEELSDNFEDVVERMAIYLDMDMPNHITRPVLGGVHPDKGVVGDWQNYFTEVDEAFFFQYGSEAMRILGYERCLV